MPVAKSDTRRASFDFPPVDGQRLRRVLAALREVSAATGHSVARIALAWQLTRPFVTSVIIGAKTRDQLTDNLAAAEVKLSPEHVKLLDAASARPELVRPTQRAERCKCIAASNVCPEAS